MYKILILSSLAISLALHGCETLGGAITKRSSIAFNKDTGGSLSVWNAEMSAAVVYKDGKMCMQRALAVKSIDAKTEAKLSTAVLELTSAVNLAMINKQNAPADLVSVSNSLKETATMLTTSTERTAFIDMGMFYICQIAANKNLTDTQAADLIKVIVETGAGIGKPSN